MISVQNLTKSFGERDLFKSISLSINRGEKIGLVGPNGAGKTTFFLAVLGKVLPTSGTIQVAKSIRIGYLPQEASFSSTATVLSEVLEGDETIMRLKKEKETLETEHKAASSRYGEVLHELEFYDFFNLEHKVKKILSGLGFKDKEFSRPVNALSGGWQMRVLLAKLLSYSYEILFLDEPTNFLDLAAALWFKEYLADYRGAFVMISHDRDFLTEVTNYTLVLENGTITKVKGNYDEYERLRAQRRAHALKQFNEQQKKREQLTGFISRFHAQPNKASQVRAKKKALEMMEQIVVPPDRRESIRTFRFPQARSSGHKVIELANICKSYPEVTVYKNFNLEITKHERIVLAGENGAGKSTLLKILSGVIDIDMGRRILGHNVDIGYFSQTRMDVLNPDNTVFDEACRAAAGRLTQTEIRTVLAAFLFVGDDVEKKVTVLSGGEKSRLILAKLLMNPPNLLLLDEPTTHLDLDAVEALIKALTDYEGTLVFISHDIHFVRSVANAVYEVAGGAVSKFPGNFDYYWQMRKSGSPAALPPDVSVEVTLAEKPRSQLFLDREAKKKRKTHNARTAKRITELRQEREKLELERNVKARILSNPRSYHNTEMVVEYAKLLKEMEKRLAAIDKELEKLKESFL